MKVRISEEFRSAYKRLKKRHKSLEADFERLLTPKTISAEIPQGVPAVRVYPLFLFLRRGMGNWGKCDVFHNFIWGNVREYEYNV